MDPNENEDRSSHSRTAPPVPRWVVLLAIAGVAILTIAVIVMLLSGGEHGPGRH